LLLLLLLLLLTVFASSCGRFTTPVSQNRHDSPMPMQNCSRGKQAHNSHASG
jgi:hypothetical protein